jgi:hypothetical protein
MMPPAFRHGLKAIFRLMPMQTDRRRLILQTSLRVAFQRRNGNDR